MFHPQVEKTPLIKNYFKVPVTKNSFLVMYDNTLELFIDGKPTGDPQLFEFDTSKLLDPHCYVPVLWNGYYYLIMNNTLYVLDNGIIELAELPEQNEDDLYKMYILENKLHVLCNKSIYTVERKETTAEFTFLHYLTQPEQYFQVFDTAYKLYFDQLWVIEDIQQKKVIAKFDEKFECTSFQCFGVLQFETIDQKEFLIVDLFSDVKRVYNQKELKINQINGFDAIMPEKEYFSFNPNLFDKMEQAIYSQKSENEEFISAYEIAEGNEEYQKTIEEKVFAFLLKFNPLIKSEYAKKQEVIQNKQKQIEEMKQKIAHMQQIQNIPEEMIDPLE